MSDTIQPNASHEFQAHFGGAPGASDLAAECKKWEELCRKVIAERDQLRSELTQKLNYCELLEKSLARIHAENFKVCFNPDNYNFASALAQIDDKPTVADIITELKHGAGK